jgi:hypothetical protein
MIDGHAEKCCNIFNMNKVKIFGFVVALSVFLLSTVEVHALESAAKQKMEKSMVTLEELIKFKKKHPYVKPFLKEAAKSRYIEVRIIAPAPTNLKAQDENDLPTKEWTEWTIKNTHQASLNDMGKVLSTLAKVPKGQIQLRDPNDAPLAYDRRFLQLEYDGDSITNLEQRSL